MVTGDDHRGVFVEGLLLQPPDEFHDLPAGAGDGVFVAFLVFVSAKLAGVAADMVGIHRQHGEGEGLILLGNFRQLLLGVGEEMLVLHAPPDEVVPGHDAILPGGVDVIDLIYAVGPVIGLSAAETGIGAHHQRLIVAVFRQNIKKCCGTGQEHAVLAVAILPVHDAVRHFQGDAAGLAYHGADGPADAGQLHKAADTLVVGEIHILLGQIVKLRDQVVGKSAA